MSQISNFRRQQLLREADVE